MPKTSALLMVAGLLATAGSARALAEPHQSTTNLPTSNGQITAAFDTAANKVDLFLEHPYQSAAPNVSSRNFLYDTYPGVRVGAQTAWLNSITPSLVEYVQGTNVVHVVRQTFGVTIDEWDFAPMSLQRGALFTVVKATRTSGSGAVDVFALHNYHLGSGSPTVGADGENIAYNAGRDAFYEWGPSGVAFGYGAFGSTHHGATPNNPYNVMLSGANLGDDAGTSGPTTDADCGFQFSLGNIATPAYAGWFSILDPGADAQSAVDAARTFIASRTPDKVLADEISSFQSWTQAAPSGSSALESGVFLQSQAMLRMAQVSASDASDGQILAAIAPGEWNITWVRDMAYATVALARTGHAAEAKRALAFEMGATVGGYQSYVGAPYQISVVRYYGNGTEWSDTNQDGPNVEFDGFGLFLWALDAYYEQTKDSASLQTWWPAAKSKVADVLLSLQDTNGLIAPDSSIWEVHWNGQQKHFTYTTVAAARGLCAAAALATAMNDSASAAKYLAAGQKARDALLGLRAPDGTLAQAQETLASGTGWLDAAVIEAMGLGLVDPTRHTSHATIASIQSGLVPPSGRGFFRNQGGGAYDSAEWIFVDMRVGRMMEASGQGQASADLLSWNVAQAADNFGILSELHDRLTADYAGAAPMVGFGAGAYLLSLLDRGHAVEPACGAFAPEPPEPSDAGADADAASDAGNSMQDASNSPDGGNPPTPESGGCSCATAGGNTTNASAIAVLLGALFLMRRKRFGLVLFLVGCSSTPSSQNDGGPASDGGASDVTIDVPILDVDAGACATTFTFTPSSGSSPKSVSVSGEWDGFTTPTTLSGPDASGAFNGKVPLAPGWWAYKLIVDGTWQLDPASTMRKYVTGTENSAVTVTDCYVPTLSVASQSNTKGHYTAQIAFTPGVAQTQIDTTSATATIRNDFTDKTIAATVNGSTISVDAPSLANGKYTIFVGAKDRVGRATAPLRLVFWMEDQTFDWRDSVIYMAVTDRLKNGDPSNDVAPTPNVDPRADFHNGDLAGVEKVIESGSLDQLGVRTIWLTPFNTNPKGPYLDSDNYDNVTGYHGYWPTKGREVDPRLGGSDALKAMVKSAHAHGMRVLMDFVIHHVHQEHEYFKAHPEWFHQGCLCGSDNCDWDSHRLDCVFTNYLPNIDWTNPDASQQFEDDAVWWLDQFDLDGFRVDAVKQVPDAAVMNVTTAVRREFEASGLRVFMTGETAMGWSDCDLACNQWQYDLISHYIGPWTLDGQFDFPLYYAVPMQAFVADYHGMIHADYWSQASGWEYPNGSIMSPYIGSQDTPRFVTLNSDPARAGNKWTNYAGPPTTSEPYQRLRVAMSWLLGQPGAPMIYYGDEYGEWGGADPNNRHDWRGDSNALSLDEQTTLALTRKLGQARKSLVALRRGAYVHVFASEPVVVFARVTAQGDVALVGINKTSTPQPVTFSLPPSLGLKDGAQLTDYLGGSGVQVAGQSLTVTLPAWGQAIWAP
jgi:glycosidase